GRQVIKFTVPEIAAPIPLEFKNPQGETVFTAKLTPLSMKAVSDNFSFDDFSMAGSELPDSIDPYDAQAVADWYADESHRINPSAYPKFLDGNMDCIENACNGNVYRIDGFGYERLMSPDIGLYLDETESVAVFGSDPELEKVKYIEWFGCTAEINFGG
ncbi:MAG: hypothetical protein K2G87_04800, partial [Oscillospiraceae bacterium]|nr:hypothetical protein [Oscillospiraceae bacterium]